MGAITVVANSEHSTQIRKLPEKVRRCSARSNHLLTTRLSVFGLKEVWVRVSPPLFTAHSCMQTGYKGAQIRKQWFLLS